MIKLSLERDWLPNENGYTLGDKDDWEFEAEKPFTVGYAFSSRSHRIAFHEEYGKFEMTLKKDGSPSFPPPPAPVVPLVELEPEVYNKANVGKNLRNGFFVQARHIKPNLV